MVTDPKEGKVGKKRGKEALHSLLAAQVQGYVRPVDVIASIKKMTNTLEKNNRDAFLRQGKN
jgi:hypothetical protein